MGHIELNFDNAAFQINNTVFPSELTLAIRVINLAHFVECLQCGLQKLDPWSRKI